MIGSSKRDGGAARNSAALRIHDYAAIAARFRELDPQPAMIAQRQLADEFGASVTTVRRALKTGGLR